MSARRASVSTRPRPPRGVARTDIVTLIDGDDTLLKALKKEAAPPASACQFRMDDRYDATLCPRVSRAALEKITAPRMMHCSGMNDA